MNAVEIEQAITHLAEQPFDAANFPYAFLEAFGNKATTIKRLRAGASNKSDLGGVLQTNNIHIATCPAGAVTGTLAADDRLPASSHAPIIRALTVRMKRSGMKRAANLSIDAALLEQARALDINLSATFEASLREAVRKRKAAEWLEENRAALQSSNEWVEKNGLPLAQYRQF